MKGGEKKSDGANAAKGIYKKTSAASQLLCTHCRFHHHVHSPRFVRLFCPTVALAVRSLNQRYLFWLWLLPSGPYSERYKESVNLLVSQNCLLIITQEAFCGEKQLVLWLALKVPCYAKISWLTEIRKVHPLLRFRFRKHYLSLHGIDVDHFAWCTFRAMCDEVCSTWNQPFVMLQGAVYLSQFSDQVFVSPSETDLFLSRWTCGRYSKASAKT